MLVVSHQRSYFRMLPLPRLSPGGVHFWVRGSQPKPLFFHWGSIPSHSTVGTRQPENDQKLDGFMVHIGIVICSLSVVNLYEVFIFYIQHYFLEMIRFDQHGLHKGFIYINLVLGIQWRAHPCPREAPCHVKSFNKLHLYTLPETNIAPLNGPSQNETSTVFQPSIFRCYVSFREGRCNLFQEWVF